MDIAKIKEIFEQIFDSTKAKSIKSVFEISEGSEYKLVISIQDLNFGETNIIHTKFIFLTDKFKTLQDSFSYLYDINCIYQKVDFTEADLKEKIQKIIDTNNFGKDIKRLSLFIADTPITNINKYFSENEVTNFSVFNLTYNPRFKIISCEDITFDFDIELSNSYNVKLTIHKEDKNKYVYLYTMMGTKRNFETEELSAIDKNVALHLIEILKENF